MQAEFIFLMTLIWFGVCHKCRQGSTVLTDEYKKVTDQFDFSNFDKQEALNYIDMQRYDNQIRGKRSGLNHNPKNVIRCHFSKNVKGDTSRQITSAKSLRKRKLIEIQNIMTRLKRKINEIQTYMMQESKISKNKNERQKRGQSSFKKNKKFTKSRDEKSKLVGSEENYREKTKKGRRHWDQWSEWSPCSVTCGKGRKLRWRRCIAKVCNTGEVEMGEKTCQLPACNVISKFFNILS